MNDGRQMLRAYVLRRLRVRIIASVIAWTINLIFLTGLYVAGKAAYAAIFHTADTKIVECTTDAECVALNPSIEFSLEAR